MPRILIVDDEEDQEELILQRFGHKEFLSDYQFTYANNGLEALKAIRKFPDIEIVLLDINMPEMDGLTFLEKSRNENPMIQSIIMSAYGDMSNIRLAMNRGAFDFLIKPINMKDLEATIIKTIDHVNQLKENSKIANENITLKEHAAELEMQALRAQMNPHFIFNSLNSINSFILQNEKEQASEYLIKFSKLIRLILENSMTPLISLSKELDALVLYMDLESLRFKHAIKIDIQYAEEMDTMAIKVPPLILQPFVENAIHHGLMPKDGPGHLLITIQETEDRLQCTITDDGIGREQAAKRQENIKHRHKSFGLSVTSERINSLIDSYSTETSKMSIRDLVDDTGNAAGTEINLDLVLIQ